MSWALVASGAAYGPAGSTGNANVTFDGTGANILFAAPQTETAGSVSTPTDDKGNTYGLVANPGGTDPTALFCAQSPTVGASMTTSCSVVSGALAVMAFSGAASSSAVDQSASSNNNGAGSGTFKAGSITPTVDGELIVSAVSQLGTASVSIDSGLTIAQQLPLVGGSYSGVAIAYFAQTTAAAIDPQWSGFSGGAAAFNSGVNASFKPASGATTRPVKMAGRWGGYAGSSGGLAA